MFGPRALYLDMARLTVRALMRSRRSGSRLSRTRRPILPTRSMAVSAMTPVACTSWSRAACNATVKLARSGSMPRVLLVVKQGGNQPVDAGAGAGGGSHGDLGLDDANQPAAERGAVGAVAVAAQHGQLRTAAVGAGAYQHVRAGAGDGGE